MGFFSILLNNRDLLKHDGRPLWNYNLSDDEFVQLHSELNQVRPYNLDPRDATLYFAEWWKRHYHGGSPSRKDIYNSLDRNSSYTLSADVLYENARKGAQMLGVKWIQNQNVLYFRTLLLQGGIPIMHIAENKSYYQAFLLALLELQPNTVEDIALTPQVIKLLPTSSQNETIYENCLAIVRSILNDEDTYTKLLDANHILKEIRNALHVRKNQLNKVARVVRPKLLWVMKIKDGVAEIHLRIGFGNKYTAFSLSEVIGLAHPAEQRTYKIYLDERLICTFRKTLSGDYKTEWENQKLFQWNSKQLAPQFYCVCNGERWEINELIFVQPNVDAPMLWTPLGDGFWRLVKGNAIDSSNALLVFPEYWLCSIGNCEKVYLGEDLLMAVQFEGELTVRKGESEYKYFSKVDSFEWNIRTQKPGWMRKTNLAIVTSRLIVHVYNNSGEILSPTNYKVYFRSSGSESLWKLSEGNPQIPIGSIDVKIDHHGVVAYDRVFNIGDLKFEATEKKIDCVKIKFHNSHSFGIILAESAIFSATTDNSSFFLQIHTEQIAIPDSIFFSLKHRNQKLLYFDIAAPFSGIGLIDKDSMLLCQGSMLKLNDLHGIRILTTNKGETTIKLWNKLRDQVKISRTIHFAHQPLINFKDDMERLFYLADAMRHDNLVMIELSDGKQKQNFCVKGFSHSVNDVSTQLARKILVESSNSELQLYAVPLNCKYEDIQILSLQRDEDNYYHLPEYAASSQFVLISNASNGTQLQPRFINTDSTFKGKSQAERIIDYHSILLQSDYSSTSWQKLLAYYNICLQQKIPFSTFDQLRAIGRSSTLAAKSFFFLAVNQADTDEYLQRQVPAIEQDLGFCFHWVAKQDWEQCIEIVEKWVGIEYYGHAIELMAKHFQEETLNELYRFLGGQKITAIARLNHQAINALRGELGERVLNELPQHTPHTTNEYGIPVTENYMIKLLLRAPIAVAESIKGIAEKSIWKDDEFVANLRRNIQYAQFIAPDFYKKVLYQCLS